jgi:hypothetical protein
MNGKSIRSWPRRIRDAVGLEGPWRLILRVLVSPVYGAVGVHVQPLECEPYELGPLPAPTGIRKMTADDIEALLAFRPEYRREELWERLRSGHECFMSLVGDDLASCRWICTGEARVGSLGLVLPLRRDEVFLYEVYTHANYRGRRINREAWNAMVDEYLGRGALALVGFTTVGRKPYGRNDRRNVATIRSLRLGPFKRFWVRTYGPQAESWSERLRELRWA